MNPHIRLSLAWVLAGLLIFLLAGLLLLKGWSYQSITIPNPLPVDPAVVQKSISNELVQEKRQKMIDRDIRVSAGIYRRYSCPAALARPTAYYSVRNRVSVRLVTAVVIVESSCRPHVISKAGAIGYMQILPKAHHLSRRALQNPDTNLNEGSAILSRLVRTYGYEYGLANYFGVTEGSIVAYDYADKVLIVAGYKKGS